LKNQERIAFTILAAICLTYFVENFLRNAASALTPVLITDLGISRGAMGLLITGYYLIYGIMQLPAGVLADILGPRKSIIGFTALTCIGSVLFWLSYRYELLLVAQVIMGIGTSVFYINAINLIVRWFPPDRKATAIGVLSASSGIGGFVSYMGFPLATTIWGSWRDLYFVMLVVLVANWVLNFFIIRDNPQPVAQVSRERRNILKSFKETLSDKRFGPLLFAYTLLGFNYVLMGWGTQFMIEAKGLTYVEAGVVTSLGTVAGFLGCLAMGVISDRLKKRRLPIISFIGVYVLLLCVLIFMPSGYPVALYAGLWGVMGISNSIWVLFFSMVGEVLPLRKASIGLGLLNGLNIIFSSLMTPIYGSLVDTTGSFFIPGMISLGIGVLTFIVLFISTKETYGVIIKD
jgi:MFS family permease